MAKGKIVDGIDFFIEGLKTKIKKVKYIFFEYAAMRTNGIFY